MDIACNKIYHKVNFPAERLLLHGFGGGGWVRAPEVIHVWVEPPHGIRRYGLKGVMPRRGLKGKGGRV